MMRRCTMLAPMAVAGAAAYLRYLRPRVQHWGATAAEIAAALPGDDLLPAGPGVRVTTRAITIDAPPAAVWPWLVQMGTNKAGVYSYDWIENLLGMHVRSLDRLVPEHQHLAVGDWNPTTGDRGMRVELVEPERAMAARSPDGAWLWSFTLAPLADGRTRLISRNRFRVPGPAGLIFALAMEPPSLVMERKMLRGFRQRAESRGATLLDDWLPEYEFRGVASTVVQASPAAVLRAARSVTLAEMPAAHFLGRLRYLPARLLGRDAPVAEDHRPFLEVVQQDGGNILLAEEPDREIVLGAAGQWHHLVNQQPRRFATPEDFRAFAEPRFQKLAQSLRIARTTSDGASLLVFEHRTHALSPAAHRWFSLYWVAIKPASGLMVRLLLGAIKRRAEREREAPAESEMFWRETIAAR